MFGKNKNRLFFKWQFISLAIFFIFLLCCLIAYLAFENKFENKIYPGIFVGDINIGNLEFEEAKKILNKKVDEINQNGIIFTYQNQQTALLPVISSLEADLAYPIITFEVEKTITRALNFGRSKNLFSNSIDKTKLLTKKVVIPMAFSLNEGVIKQVLAENFSGLETPAEDAKLIYKKNYNGIEFDVSEEKLGQKINYESGIKTLGKKLITLNNSPIDLSAKTDYPNVYKKDCLNIDAKAQNIIDLSPVSLRYGKKEIYIKRDRLADWLTLEINTEEDRDKINVGLDYKKIEEFLNEFIVPDFNEAPKDAKLEIKDGRVVEFQISKDGVEINIDASFEKIKYEILKNKNSEIELVSRELKSSLQNEDINDLGIKEIIGTGESNFAGSPQNRRHNIKTGAESLNGLLIKPDEEFSINNALGEINAETGYLPELVIKDNKTIPEYGGGLCQIGTTMFRTALGTGLPITMRRNHSYRVSYYEPAGTDATIYDPWPDLKFINDTGNYILIQSRIEGDNLFFDFWGTSDGRKATTTYPTIYNIVKPGPTRLIETLDLAPGEKKCTERAHNGADAYFDYTVTYPNDEIKEERFSSHYVPWREVCLMGVEKLSSEIDTATSSPEQ